MMKKIITIGTTLLCFVCSFAQQDVQYTQYMYNKMAFNPGYTATSGIPSIVGLYRSQWIGIDGAPKNIVLSGQTPIKENRQGIGFTVENDKIGPSSDTRLAFSYAHPVMLSDEIIMSLGVNICGNFMEIDYDKLKILDHTDKELRGKLSQFSPNIGAGAYFYSKKWFAGLSVPDFLETKFYNDIQSSVAKRKMHYYLTGSYSFDLDDMIQFKPGALIKMVPGAPLGVDVSTTFLFNDKLQLGISYRWGNALSFLTGFKIGDFTVGYAYDYSGGTVGTYTSGTHEAFLQFDILKKHAENEDKDLPKHNHNTMTELLQRNKTEEQQDLELKNKPVKTNPTTTTENKQFKNEKHLRKEQAKREKKIKQAQEKALRKEARKKEKVQQSRKEPSKEKSVSKAKKSR
ncbi:MAG TPA: PorP/SprF family type IX secretion system membrane protein [Flavobacterium sp.]|nr:PorP/SprF family type IX secretion system membrane protein [Flavobacterium sp.]